MESQRKAWGGAREARRLRVGRRVKKLGFATKLGLNSRPASSLGTPGPPIKPLVTLHCFQACLLALD